MKLEDEIYRLLCNQAMPFVTVPGIVNHFSYVEPKVSERKVTNAIKRLIDQGLIQAERSIGYVGTQLNSTEVTITMLRASTPHEIAKHKLDK